MALSEYTIPRHPLEELQRVLPHALANKIMRSQSWCKYSDGTVSIGLQYIDGRVIYFDSRDWLSDECLALIALQAP